MLYNRDAQPDIVCCIFSFMLFIGWWGNYKAAIVLSDDQRDRSCQRLF